MEQEKIDRLKSAVRTVPDFPVKGVMFRDFTTVFQNPATLQLMREELRSMYADKGITKVVGIEARGFIAGAILAADLGAGFVPIRKPGKLPAATYSASYKKEYGIDKMEIHSDAISADDVVLIHDDVLATGGTLLAAIELVKKFNPKQILVNCLIDLTDLKGSEHLPADIEMRSLLEY